MLHDQITVYSRQVNKHIELITSLSIIKTGKHIGFHRNLERQIFKSIKSNSAYQNEIIKYITTQNKIVFEGLKNKIQDNLRNKHELIEDEKLRYIINILIYNLPS